jgi:hypothetical protein
MMNTRMLALATTAAVIAVPATALAASPAGAAPARAAAATTRRATLTHSSAYPKATGSATYQAQSTHRELQVELNHLTSLAGKRVRIAVGRTRMGSAKVTKAGILDVSWNTESKQKVPAVTKGKAITARTSTGTLIASGHFS